MLADSHPGSPSDAVGALASYEERQRTRASIVTELMGGVSEARAKALAVASKVANDYERAAWRHEEDAADKHVERELTQIKSQKARMRSGVVPEDQAPKLPLARSSRTH